MRLLFILSCICLSIGCGTTKKSSASSTVLNGTWIPVRQEMGGSALPPAIFQTQKLIISDSSYTFSAESVDKGILHYKNGQMDIYGKEGVNTGKHFPALYKFENGLLTICYNLKGDSYPEDFDTKSKPAFFMSVFRKN